MLNRSAVMVRPKQPYLDWAAQLDDSDAIPDPHDQRIVYLIPECDDDDSLWEILEEVYPEIFETELYGYHTDEGAWPQQRDFAMFKEWFEVELSSIVEDLCDYEIFGDEDGDENL
jgi:hypothetical protein